jgi:hypothetical protein
MVPVSANGYQDGRPSASGWARGSARSAPAQAAWPAGEFAPAQLAPRDRETGNDRRETAGPELLIFSKDASGAGTTLPGATGAQ